MLRYKSAQIFLLVAAALVASPAPTLRQAAAHAGALIGAAVRPSQLHEAAYAETLSREFNMVEAEDVMKWWVIRRDRDKFDFSQADELVRFAEAHHMKIRGHCLVWGRDNPDWLTQGKFTSAKLSQILHDHIAIEVKRYAGQVFAWDVVNEAFDEHGKLRDSVWYDQPGIGLAQKGTAYLEQAFRWAHEADPQALLFYNESEAEETNTKSDAIYAMLKDFKQRGVPVNGVGMQFHISAEPDMASVAANMARVSALGLQIHITELDVSLPLRIDEAGRRESPSSEELNRQTEIYGDIVRICLENPSCTAVQTWGFTDKYSWIGSHSHGSRGAALLFDREYRPKPAYNAILHELERGREKAFSAH